MIKLEVKKEDVNFARYYDCEGYSFSSVSDYSEKMCLEQLLEEYDIELIAILDKTPENIEKIFGKEIKELYFSAMKKRQLAAENRKKNTKKGWENKKKK